MILTTLWSVFTIIGIPYFAYMIGALADLISLAIDWIRQKRHLSSQLISAAYLLFGAMFMIVIPAHIFIKVEG